MNLQQLQDEFWRTRVEAKDAYKAWQVMPDDSRLMKAYADAWALHQAANMMQFLAECMYKGDNKTELLRIIESLDDALQCQSYASDYGREELHNALKAYK